MKSYILPLVIGAAVIAATTLIYTLVLPIDDGAVTPDQPVAQTVIETPAETKQTVLEQQTVPSETGEEAIDKLVIDIARVQADGMAVFAGRGAPNASIFITENGAIFAQNIIDSQGQWVVLPDQPLSAGAHLLQLEMVTTDGRREQADISIVVEVAANGDEKPLVALVPQTDEGDAKILQIPEAEEAEKPADKSSSDGATQTASQTEAETVAEILGQDEIFIQIGSLSWNETGGLTIQGVASGGVSVAGTFGAQDLSPVPLAKTGRWTSVIADNPFDTGAKQQLIVLLLDAQSKELAKAELSVDQAQLQAGLDGSLMVVVHRGDALWRIAYRSYGKGVRYVDIVRRNQDQISDPDLIYPNQIFAVPGANTE